MAEPPKELVEALETAVAAVKKAKVPKNLQEAAFNAAFSGSSSSSSGIPSRPPGDLQRQGGGKGGKREKPRDPDEQPFDPEEGFSNLAAKLKVDLALVELVYDLDEEGVHLLVARAALDAAPSTQQQEVALLVLAGRQGAGLEDMTAAGVVREAAKNLGAYEGNHSTYVGELSGPRMRIRGKGQSRELKLNQPGFEEAAGIVTRLAQAT